jgi:hypothetical protein
MLKFNEEAENVMATSCNSDISIPVNSILANLKSDHVIGLRGCTSCLLLHLDEKSKYELSFCTTAE